MAAVRDRSPDRSKFSFRLRLRHNSGVINDAENPCQRHGCHVCCVDTQMTLTRADVTRLENAGFSGFFRQDRFFDLVLKNSGGQCIFLCAGLCRVYEVRPEGCRLYPLVLDLSRNRVARHDLCPHRREFAIAGDDADRLRRSVAQETMEATQRRRIDG